MIKNLLKTEWQRQLVRFVLLFVTTVIGSLLAMNTFERMLLSQVQLVTETANVAFTRLFVNEAWSDIKPLLDIDAKVHPGENPLLGDVDMRVRRFAKGTDLIKVKIYNVQGLTVYSSNPAQIGEVQSENKGFQAALRGRVVSETNYRGKFGAFDGDLYERNLVSSYVPVKGAQGVEAVAEIYADRTSSIEGVNGQIRLAWIYFGGGLAVLFVLFAVYFRMGSLVRSVSPGPDALNEAEGVAQDAVRDNTVALLHEAALQTNSECETCDRALKNQELTESDASGFGVVRESLQSIRGRFNDLVLAIDPLQAKSLLILESPHQLGFHIEKMLITFRERCLRRGIEFGMGSVPTLPAQTQVQAIAVSKLLELLLNEAAARTDRGVLRLTLLFDDDGILKIEVVGTRHIDLQAAKGSDSMPSLALVAAGAIAKALKGTVQQTYDNARGPWISASVAITE